MRNSSTRIGGISTIASSRAGGRHRAHQKVLDGPLLLVALASGFLYMWVWWNRSQPDDWAPMYIAGLLVGRGQADHLYDHNPEDFSAIAGEVWNGYAAEVSTPFPHTFVHNPLVAYAMKPLTEWLSFEATVHLLCWCSGFALVAFVASAYNLWFRSTLSAGWAAISSVLLSGFAPVVTAFFLGQTTLLIIAGVTYGLAASKYRPWLAGIILAVVSFVKITPVVLIVVLLFFAYRRRTAIVAAAVSAVLMLSSWGLAGSDVFAAWLDRLSDINSAVLVSSSNLSIASWITQGNDATPVFVQVLRDYPESAVVVPYIVAGVLTVVTFIVAWVNREFRFEILTVGAWGVSTVSASILWGHYLSVIVVFVVGVVAMSGVRFTHTWPLLGVAVVALYAVAPLMNAVGSALYNPGFGFSGLVSLLVSVVLLLVTALAHGFSAPADRPVKAEPMVIFDTIDRLLPAPQKTTVIPHHERLE